MNSVLHITCRETVRLAGSIISVRQAVDHIAMLFTRQTYYAILN